MTGPECSVDIASCRRKKCSPINPMSFSGDGYAAYAPQRSTERHLSISLGIRTTHSNQAVMSAVGPVDYNLLEVTEDGEIRYRFDFGSGEGDVTVRGVPVNDGKWHEVSLERHGNSARLALDRRHEEQGSAPGINDVLNLSSEGGDDSNLIYFGAKAVINGDVVNGFNGCLDDVRMDGVALPMHVRADSRVAHLAEVTNIGFTCGHELAPAGACGTNPCHNGGMCHPTNNLTAQFTCTCQQRFKGVQCEVDTDPCASNPCLHGGRCINLPGSNDYRCDCPLKLSGKRCQYGAHCNPNPCQNGGMCEEGTGGPLCKCRGFTGAHCTHDINECLHQNPCGNGGTCVNLEGGFKCICPPQTTGDFCTEQLRSWQTADGRDYLFNWEEVVGIIVSLFGIVILVGMWVACRRMVTDKKVVTTSGNGHLQVDNCHNESLNGGHANGGPPASLEMTEMDQRPLIPHHHHHNHHQILHRPISSYETAGNRYTDTVRSYGSAADELESPNPSSRVIDYVQQQQPIVYSKPTATVAPSMVNNSAAITDIYPMDPPPPSGGSHCMDRNMVENYLQGKPLMATTSFKPKQLQHLTGSPALKGAPSMSSMATAEENEYYWDSFDLNGTEPASATASSQTDMLAAAAAAAPLAHASGTGQQMIPGFSSRSTVSVGTAASSSGGQGVLRSRDDLSSSRAGSYNPGTLPSVCKPVDSSRDIETLPEPDDPKTLVADDDDDAVSCADSDNQPQFGSVFPVPGGPASKAPSTSFEQLLASNDDINFADDDEDSDSRAHGGSSGADECPNSYDYCIHPNNYLVSHNISEASETDEQTPMLPKRPVGGAASAAPSPYILKSTPDQQQPAGVQKRSDLSLPTADLATTLPSRNNLRNLNTLSSVSSSNANGGEGNYDDNQVCELEDSDCETPVNEGKPGLPSTPRVTRV